jgi:hypothetical protein
MSPLDSMAGRFFGAVRSIYDDLGDSKTLSRKARWFLFSGEELELWLLKTAVGLYHSGNAAKNRNKFCDRQTINPAVMQAFRGSGFLRPCGTYVLNGVENHGPRNSINFAPLSSDNNERMIGLRLTFMGLTLAILFDPRATYREQFVTTQAYRPNYLFFQNQLRKHTIVLTWPHKQSHKWVLFYGIDPVREITL